MSLKKEWNLRLLRYCFVVIPKRVIKGEVSINEIPRRIEKFCEDEKPVGLD